MIFPSATSSLSYDDNVFARSENLESDLSTVLNASLGLTSNWSQHALSLSAAAGTNLHARIDSEDTSSASVGGSALIDVYHDLTVRLNANTGFGFEPRGSGESFQNLLKPLDTRNFGSGAVVHKQFNRLWVEGGVSVSHTEFGGASVGGGAGGPTADQSFRSGSTYEYTGRTGYEISPKTSVYLEGGFNRREFGDIVFNGEGQRELIGMRYEFTRLVNADAAVGHFQSSSSGGLNDVDSWTYRANVGWSVTPLMNIALAGSRDLTSPSKLEGNSNRILSDIGLSLGYAFKRDINLSLGITSSWVDYMDTTRTEDSLSVAVGISYQYRPWLSITGQYLYQDLQSNAVPNVDFSKSVYSAGISAHY
jgi:hypothetical protein